MSELAKALLAFQSDAPTIQKDAINPHFRSKFVSLNSLMEVVLPALNKHGVLLMQLPTVVDGYGPALRTVLTYAETGESVEDVMPLQAVKDDPQGQGSALTYARRYALMSALGLVADEDDDGNAAQNRGRSTATAARENAGSESTEADSTPAPDTPFKAPAGRRGGGGAEVLEGLRSELIDLVTQLGAKESLKTVHDHADKADVAWLKRQIKIAKESLKQKGALPFE